jgi:hypothetical protein
MDSKLCKRFGRYETDPRKISLTIFLICDTDFPACNNESDDDNDDDVVGAVLFVAAEAAAVVYDAIVVVVVVVPPLVGEVAVTEAVFVNARLDEVNTRRSIIDGTKNFPDDSTNKVVEVYFSISGCTVSYNSVDWTICRYFLLLVAELFSFSMGTLSVQSASHTSFFKRGGSGRKISACFSFLDFFSRSDRACNTANGVLEPSCLRTAHNIGLNSALDVA